MNSSGLDFEKPIIELERKIEDLRKFTSDERINLSEEIKHLEQKLEKVKKDVFKNLTPWQKVQIARHPQRPFTLDYITMIMSDFIELHGDRAFKDDLAMVAGLARVDGRKVMVIGHQKGRDTTENLKRNFGSAHPEGYRKAMRLMKMAGTFKLPIVIFIDTPGAYPGIGAEERGQANSIAENIEEMFNIKVPIIVFIIGEGGSGGALGVGVGDKVAVLENAYYSVISPEGCAAILWKDAKRAKDAAASLKLNADNLLELGLIDEVIKEPLGGAHRNAQECGASVKNTLLRFLDELIPKPKDVLLKERYQKFRRMGKFSE